MKSKRRILHGPENICGIGGYLASWQRQKTAVADFVTYEDQTTRQNHHFNLQLEQYGKVRKVAIMLSFFLVSIFKYDTFHFYFGTTLLPFNIDLPILKLLRKKILMTYCGSEVRLIEIEKKRNPYSHLLKVGQDNPKFDERKKRMMNWQKKWVDIFFAPRDLYAHAESLIPKNKIIENIWIHNTIDTCSYIPTSYTPKKIPVLVHAPSEKGIKGTENVEKAIKELKQEGYQFEYRCIHKVPYDEAQRIFKHEADIIIDQLLLGIIGSLAMEGMSYGKPVVGYILEDTREKYFSDCPVVNASIDTLKEKLVWLIENPKNCEQLGREGRLFAENRADRNKVNEQLWEVYEKLWSN